MKKTVFTCLLSLMGLAIAIAQPSKARSGVKIPQFIKLSKPVSSLQKADIFQQHFKMTSDDAMEAMTTFRDHLNFEHQKYQQYYKGVPVEGATYTLHIQDGLVTHMSGNFQAIDAVDVRPRISASSAFESAVGHVSAKVYAWEGDHSHGDHHHFDYHKPDGYLVVLANADNKAAPTLTYKFDIYASDPIYRAHVFVDAHSGAVVAEHDILCHNDVAATGTSSYNGTVSFTADFTGSNYRLRQTADGNGVETYSMNNGTNYNNASDITSNSSHFTSDNTAVQAHWGAEQTHKYFLQRHNRNSYNGAGAVIRSYVHYSSNYVNAFWDGQRMTYGDGDGVNYGPLVSVDIVGHEITHGVTQFSANLVYANEPGALNESFSDIFGEAIEHYATGSNDWQMGTDIGIGGSGAIRSMDNPNAFNDPDTYLGTYWYTGSADNGGVHINSGVQNKWFYILSVGESGTNDVGNSYSVTGIGIDKAAAIAYRNLSVYLSTNSNYAAARSGAIQAAEDLYGADSPEVIATTNAWYAVGVGGEYAPPIGCVSDPVVLTINLDNYPEETSWTLTSGGSTVASGGTYGSQPDGSTVTETFNLAAGNYTFTINDSYGDGICCGYGNGSYSLVSGPLTIVTGGNFGSSESTDFCVQGGGDTQAPTAPGNLTASNTTQTSTDLSWSASSDNVGVTGYDVYVDGSLDGSTTSTSYTVSGLSAGTTYSMSVRAKDAAGNVSSPSSINVTTQSAGDTQAPTSPGNLTASNTTQTSTDLSWSPSSDNVGVVAYDVYVDGGFDGSTASTSYTVSGLSANTMYTLSVRARDAAGNASSPSAINVTTLPSGGGSTTLFAHFFETGWDGWQDGGSDCYRYSGSRSWEGNYSIRIRDNSGTNSAMTSSSYNVSGYNQLEIEFYFYPNSMETGEDFWVRYYDGSTWHTVAAYARGTNFNNNTFYVATVTISSANYNFPSNAQFRFQCDASGNADRVYIDAVTVTASNSFTFGSAATRQTIDALSTPTFMDTNSPLAFDSEADVTLFPNPVGDVLQIEAQEAIRSVQIYSATGALVRHLRGDAISANVDVADLGAGIYLVRLETEEEVSHAKFAKE